MGGIEDHAHVLILAKPIHAPSQIVQHLKGGSSKWIHTEFENLKQFAWQDGFGVFSVSKSKVSDVVDYIKNQRKHHEHESFEEEYERLMRLHDVDYDMKYLLTDSSVADATPQLSCRRFRGLKPTAKVR